MKRRDHTIRPSLLGVQGCPEPCVVQGAIRNRLIVFTRYPEPGKSKTRLIPALGPEGAADLHRQMCEHTLSWARRGAIVTGIDFSEESIRQAQALCAEYNIQAEFICSDVYDLPVILTRQFDIVYTSGGVLTWLPDINLWANEVAKYLKTGGVFYLRDSHPFRRVMFPIVEDGSGGIVQYHYFSTEPARLDMRGSYAQPNAETIHPAYFWVHGLGEIVSALCAAGFKIEYLREFPKVYENFPAYVQPSPGQFEMHVIHDWAVPNTFSLRAIR